MKLAICPLCQAMIVNGVWYSRVGRYSLDHLKSRVCVVATRPEVLDRTRKRIDSEKAYCINTEGSVKEDLGWDKKSYILWVKQTDNGIEVNNEPFPDQDPLDFVTNESFVVKNGAVFFSGQFVCKVEDWKWN